LPPQLSQTQRETLRAVCDAVVPSIEHQPDPDGFWTRKATDLGVDVAAEETLLRLPAATRDGLLGLLDALYGMGITRVSVRSAEQLLRNVSLMGTEGAAGAGGLTGLVLFLTYGLPDPATGQNPMWQTFGYPGPLSAPTAGEKPISPLVPEGDALELQADVVVVGSGAGGGVIAGTLAQQGLDVVVVEAGGYLDESDFLMLELPAYQQMYWRGGPQPTADLNVSLMAGATLGGGTTVNWTNCLRTTPWVREEWEREHGLEGVAGADFDRHLDAVWRRLGVTGDCSHLNGPQQRMREGAEALGWSFAPITRNTDAERYDPATAAYMGFGDQTGAKNSTLRTYLVDAVEAGARILVRTAVERVLVEGGRAAGVEGTFTDPDDGRSARVTVRARQVVVAAGALESPALLLRSGIGGPAVGRYLRLHPCTATFGMYGEDQRAWWGAPQAGLVDQFAAVEDGYGFLVESAQYAPGLIGSALPFASAREHKALLERTRFGGTFIGLLRDHGAGRVEIDADGQAVPTYAIADPLDLRNARRALDAQVRLHAAAGATEIHALAFGAPAWRRGEDIGAFIARLQRVPLRFGGLRLFSAHQMGTCRMGADPASSVAGPFGELHDTPGVWIGDASAFPTSSGTNPMISIMALAHRTAEAIAAEAGATGAGAAPTTTTTATPA